MGTIDANAFVAATGNLLSGLLVMLQEKGLLSPADVQVLIDRTVAKSDQDILRPEVIRALQVMFPSAKIGP